MTTLINTTFMLCERPTVLERSTVLKPTKPTVLKPTKPTVSFGSTSYEKTFSENIVSGEEEIVTKKGDGPNQYSRVLSKLVEAYLGTLHTTPQFVHDYLGDDVAIKVLGDMIRMSLDGIIDIITETSKYTLIYGCGRLNVTHLEKLRVLRDVIRIAQLEIRCSELIAQQSREMTIAATLAATLALDPDEIIY
jgi:hypothetical protein